MTKEQAKWCMDNKLSVFYRDNDGESKEVLILNVVATLVLIGFKNIAEEMDNKYRWVDVTEIYNENEE